MNSKHPTRWPLIVAWCGTVTACAFAIAPQVIAVSARFDSIAALTALTVVGLVWYTYFTQQALAHSREQAAIERDAGRAEQQRLRESLATAVLAELATVLPRLRNLAEETAPTSDTLPTFLNHAMLDQATVRPELFSKATIRGVTLAANSIADVQLYLSVFPSLKDKIAEATSPKADERARAALKAHIGLTATRATWAYNETAAIVPLLSGEGGLMPGALQAVAVRVGEKPSLVPDPMPESGSGVTPS